MSTVAEAPRNTVPAGRPRVITVGVGLSSAGLVAAPFLITAVTVLTTGHLVLGGDQALIGLDALDARHLEQGVGPYSRMGWAHPGPAWTYLLAPLWWVLGSTSPALIAASLLVHALGAVLVVAAAGGERAWQRPVMAAVLLLYVIRMPAVVFVNIWNPFALLLPALLLLLVAARACAGSCAALATTALVGSYLVQTHVGTVPLVALVGGTVVIVSGVRLVRWHRLAWSPAQRLGTSAAAAGTLLIWVPPLWQQFAARPPEQGNLGLLASYFVHGAPAGEQHHTWSEAISAVGQLLGAPVYGWVATPAPVVTSMLTAAVVCAVTFQIGGGLAVAAWGLRSADSILASLGLLTSVAGVAGLVAARTVTGVMQNYLILWVTVLPPALLFAGIWLVAGWHRLSARAPRLAAAGLAGAVVLCVGASLSLHRSAQAQLPDQPGAAAAAQLALDALPAPRADDPPVLLDIADVSAWSTATAVAVDLELAGHRVSVEQEWVYSFGQDRASRGNEVWRVSMVPVEAGDPAVPGQVGVVPAINGPIAVGLTRTRR
jgi:hypothetical protein